MCGISGCSWRDPSLIKRMLEAVSHRGPDDHGLEQVGDVTFGHVRLSIIELSRAGHQPMFYAKQKGASSSELQKSLKRGALVSIVYNGEIYNYQELRKDLKKKGYVFSTRSDTEVILASYLEWGFDCVKHFNGMWAFCIHDRMKKVLFCSRDRLGQKPLYYHWNNNGFLFCSELKGLLQYRELADPKLEDLDREAVELYFSLGYIPAPWTIYKDIRKLEAAFNLIIDLDRKRLTKQRYWDLPPYSPQRNKQKLIEQGRALLQEATRLRMIADVPVGAFLSGGLDSSAVVGKMRELTDISKVHTFSLGFEGTYDETPYVNLVKKNYTTRHHHQYFLKNDFEALIKRYAEVYDEPYGDCSGFPTYKVSEMARKYVKVCLSGDGGDEIFGGYNNHLVGRRMDIIRRLPKSIRWLASRLPAKRNLSRYTSFYMLKQAFRVSLNPPERFSAEALGKDRLSTSMHEKWTTSKLKKELVRGQGSLAEALRTHDLLNNTLGDHFLVKVDRASMAHALEVRSPFLDHRFAEWAQKVPSAWKASLFQNKILMREIIRGLVPEAIVRRGKQGFTPPFDKWILNEEYEKFPVTALKILRKILPQLHAEFKTRILKEKGIFFLQYYLRLFLFGIWSRKWINQ
ncbi:MAG: asparagine synthase (glutamine-hydrolyzing) [Candidatus Aminicenantes bacterium]|nr:asparagine synthase (glutamine-hydrolyzing) [Candidatus Aminicenantes bacterium]